MKENNREEIEIILTKLLSNYGDVKKFIKKNKSFNFVEEGFIDSLNLIIFFEKIEKKFKIKIKDSYSSSKKFGDFNDLVKYIVQSKNKII